MKQIWKKIIFHKAVFTIFERLLYHKKITCRLNTVFVPVELSTWLSQSNFWELLWHTVWIYHHSYGSLPSCCSTLSSEWLYHQDCPIVNNEIIFKVVSAEKSANLLIDTCMSDNVTYNHWITCRHYYSFVHKEKKIKTIQIYNS